MHVIGPELGLTQPGMTVVCGDSHTATHGAFGALAFGIGTSEVEHVLATQCLLQRKSKTFQVRVDGALQAGRFGQGHHSGADRADRRRRRHGQRVRIHRQRHPRAVHGRAHDGVQHVDRRRRARRPGGAGRHHVRISLRPPACAQGRGVGCRAGALEAAAHRRGRGLRPRRHHRRRCARAHDHLRHQSRHGRADQRAAARSRASGRPDGARIHRQGAALHGSRRRQAAAGPPHRRGVHRKLHQFAHLRSAHRGRRC